MNAMTPSRTQEYFSAVELADLARDRGITTFPTTKSGVIRYVRAQGWDVSHLCRKRAGRGGGLEYHYTLLPDAMRAALEVRLIKAAVASRLEAETLADQRRLMALKASALPARARRVMEARAEILVTIEGYAVSRGERRAWGIARFLEAVAAYIDRQEIEARRDAGEILTPREAESLARPLLLLLDFALDAARLVVANDRPNGSLSISERTLYRWFKARDERGAIALAPVPPKAQQPIPPAFGDFLKHYALPGKPSIAEAYRTYTDACAAREGAQPVTLTLAQVEYIVSQRLNEIEKHVGREGLLTLRSRMAYVTRTTDDMWPTTVYTADGKTFDAEVADPVSGNPMRPEITSVLDVATRKCVGYAVSRKENVIAVTEALRRSCSAHGICAIFYTDRGAGYKNKTFDADAGGLMGRLGITKMHALPYNSQAKGIIERFNHVWNDLAKRYPTYIGKDMDKEASQRAHKATRTQIREFGRSNILPSWEFFIAEVERTIAEYNDRPHSGLPKFEDPETGRKRHMTPNEAWAAHVANGFEPVSIDPGEEDDLFRPYEVRTAARAQVEWNTNKYFHLDLEPYHGRRVMVGYDLHQADQVWVREYDEDSGQPGRLICIATFAGNKQRYIPLTAQRAAEEQRAKGQLRRLGRKVEAVHEQLQAPLLEAEVLHPAQFVPARTPDPQPVALRLDPEPDVGRRVTPITSDAELARLCLADPGQLTPGRAQILRDALGRRSGQELLRLAGVDLEALSDLIRSAAA